MDAKAKKLCDRIVGEARTKAAEIVAESRVVAERELERAKAEAESSAEAYLAKAKAEAERDSQRRVSVGQLDLRNEELALKQGLIDSVFDEALARLRSMGADEYGRLLTSIVMGLSLNGSYQLVAAATDEPRIGAPLVNSLNEAMKSRGLGTVQFGGYSEAIEAGFILVQGDVVLNFSFVDMLSDFRETLEGEVAQLLFGQ